MNQFNGLALDLGNIWRLSKAQTRSISPENFAGEKGKGGMSTDGAAAAAARDLGQGWKVSPYVKIGPGETFTLAEITGPGAIQNIWFAGIDAIQHGRDAILRIYWDDQEQPSVECPLGDFFALAWETYAQLSSLPIVVNPRRGLNCYWPMPFHKRCRVTLENRNIELMYAYYQINYTLTEVPEDAAYFHAQFRRINPLPYKEVYTILDGIQGTGHFVGTYLAVGVTNCNWWGEGEIKFYIDGDEPFPTICGTGTEDYFGGSYDWDVNGLRHIPLAHHGSHPL
jgi:hypothetical protein